MATSKILIVDDMRTILRSLQLILSKEDFIVVTANSGEEAIRVAVQEQPDLIIMDIQMNTGMDGLEACRLLKTDEQFKDTPVLFLSAFEDTETKLKGFEAGGVDFIPKSFNTLEIITRVKIHIKIATLQKALRRENNYAMAILNAQKDLVLIYNSSYEIESSNTSCKNFFGITGPLNEFSLVKYLGEYDNNIKIPASDKDLICNIWHGLSTKVSAHSATDKGVFSISINKNIVLGELKYIVVLTEITMYEKVRMQEVELFKYRERYHTNQQITAFKKQLKIIKDRLSRRKHDGLYIDTFYKPLDLLSGDTYGTIEIAENKFIFYIIDAMGKGLSASVTSIQSTSFINNTIETAVENNKFSFEDVILDYNHFIRKQILDDELVCALFVYLDLDENTMHIANYGMPPMLIQKQNGSVHSITSNNSPIMNFLSSSNIDAIPFSHTTKVLMYSDGLNENETKERCAYQKHLLDNFANAPFLKVFIDNMNEKVEEYDDDLTMILLVRPQVPASRDFTLPSNTQGIQDGIMHLVTYLDEQIMSDKSKNSLLSVTRELLTNAHEYGNLGVNPRVKNNLSNIGEYAEYIAKLENDESLAKKSIYLSLNRVEDKDSSWIKVTITDEGQGFDFTTVLQDYIFEDQASLEGRGVAIAKDVCDGMYFNKKGNSVTVVKLV